MTLTEFLLARIAEDEAAARAATQGRWTYDHDDEDGITSDSTAHNPGGYVAQTSYDGQSLTEGNSQSDGVHIARFHPARVLAECEAKRRIVELVDWLNNQSADFRVPPILSDLPSRLVLRHLALPYADHPGYDEAWRP